MAEQVVEMVGADVVRMLTESGYAGMDLLGPFLVGGDFREFAQVGVLLARLVALQPFVDVDARARRACVQDDAVIPCADGVSASCTCWLWRLSHLPIGDGEAKNYRCSGIELPGVCGGRDGRQARGCGGSRG